MPSTKCPTAANDVIDHFIDGEPMMISPGPGFRRVVRERIYERSFEEREARARIRRRFER